MFILWICMIIQVQLFVHPQILLSNITRSKGFVSHPWTLLTNSTRCFRSLKKIFAIVCWFINTNESSWRYRIIHGESNCSEGEQKTQYANYWVSMHLFCTNPKALTSSLLSQKALSAISIQSWREKCHISKGFIKRQ